MKLSSIFVLRRFNKNRESNFYILAHKNKDVFLLGPFLSFFNALKCCVVLSKFFKQHKEWLIEHVIIIEPKLNEQFLNLKNSKRSAEKRIFKRITDNFKVYHPAKAFDKKLHPKCFQVLLSKSGMSKILELLKPTKLTNIVTGKVINVQYNTLSRSSCFGTFFAEVPMFFNYLSFQKPPKSLKAFGSIKDHSQK